MEEYEFLIQHPFTQDWINMSEDGKTVFWGPWENRHTFKGIQAARDALFSLPPIVDDFGNLTSAHWINIGK